jgi:type I restriction enzyme M protein
LVRMYESDTQLRDAENVAKAKDQDDEELVKRYVLAEVMPHVDESWADRASIKPAYEINFNRYFYTYTPPRPLAEIDADIKVMEEKIVRLLHEVTA